ncbi:MAG: hypothetical protein QOC92_4245, partial [Acidimicrobiaceae bacterium]
AIASVCRGEFLSTEQIDPRLTIVSRRRAAFFLEGYEGRWMVPNSAGHARMLQIAGFEVTRKLRYSVPFGPGHPPRATGSVRTTLRDLGKRVVGGAADGVPHSAALCERSANVGG